MGALKYIYWFGSQSFRWHLAVVLIYRIYCPYEAVDMAIWAAIMLQLNVSLLNLFDLQGHPWVKPNGVVEASGFLIYEEFTSL